ncbi:MAG: type II toxin-antitoxin system VapC family toxin [Vulcanimicrobiaceae bacterium]
MRPGGDRVAALLPFACVSAVNLAEVASKLADARVPAATIRASLDGMQLDIRSFDVEQAYRAAGLRAQTQALGLSLGDRACLGLALTLRLPAVTADRVWSKAKVGVEIEFIRG